MRYCFGVYEFDRVRGELRKAGVLVALEAQPAKALGLLLSKRGELVSKDELRREIWGEETHVDFDRGLAYCLSEIRTALKDSGANPRFIQTLPKQGYRMIVPVEIVGGQRRQVLIGLAGALSIAAGVWVSGRSHPIRLGVSIFDNETGRPEWDRWVAGLSDVVVAQLTALAPGRLEIIGNAEALRRPRNIRQLQKLASEVRADYVALGQLQLDGAGLRFVTHLIRLADGVHLKANRLYTKVADPVSFEPEILNEYALAVKKHLLQAPEVRSYFSDSNAVSA